MEENSNQSAFKLDEYNFEELVNLFMYKLYNISAISRMIQILKSNENVPNKHINDLFEYFDELRRLNIVSFSYSCEVDTLTIAPANLQEDKNRILILSPFDLKEKVDKNFIENLFVLIGIASLCRDFYCREFKNGLPRLFAYYSELYLTFLDKDLSVDSIKLIDKRILKEYPLGMDSLNQDYKYKEIPILSDDIFADSFEKLNNLPSI